MNTSKNIQAMIFAAGLGTRLKPFTNNHPKALAPVNDVPLLQRNIAYLKSFGIHRFVINVHHFANQIIDFLEANNNFGCEILISHEIPDVLETGGGLVFAKPLLTAPNILIYNCDMLTNMQVDKLIDAHLKSQADATLAITNRKSTRNLLFNEHLALVGWQNTEKKEQRITITNTVQNAFAFSGIHMVNKEFIDKITQQGKFSMIDAYLERCKYDKIFGFNHSNDILIDVGKPESLVRAESIFK